MIEIMDRWKVCIRCSTYNHSLYVAETLDGFVGQQTEFPYVAVIVDDASTDGEQQVLMNYLSDHFEKCELSDEYDREDDEAVIHFARHKENKSCHFAVVLLKYNHNSQRLSKQHMFDIWQKYSEYVAICEGDDYWIDPLKLQKQVSVMNTDSTCGMCYTKVKRWDEKRHDFKDVWGGSFVTFNNLLIENTVPTLSVILRNDLLVRYYNEFPKGRNWLMGDYPMWLWFAIKGNITFMDDVTGVYRILPESASHSKSLHKTWDFSESFLSVQKYYIEKYSDAIPNKDIPIIYGQLYSRIIPMAVALRKDDFLKEVKKTITPYSNLKLTVKASICYRLRGIIRPFLICYYRYFGYTL